MRLLIVTQVVDRNDPVLGFFHRWIEEFAKHCKHISVICLYEGVHTLPQNVRVYSLGKERGTRSSFVYAARFLSLIWRLRREYDAAFVHMNAEYLIIAGWLWRVLGKKTALWYTHGTVNLKLRIATFFTNRVLTASRESFRVPSRKVQVMGHGIDTDFFTPDVSVQRKEHWLSVGRLMKSKRHSEAIRFAEEAGIPLRIVGEGPERERLEILTKELGGRVIFLGALTQAQLRDEYRTAARLIHRSETGSLDKVVLEAAACDCPVDTTDAALAVLPLFSSKYVQINHSLNRLIPRIVNILA